VQNKPNSSIADFGLRIVQNKPNLPGGAGRDEGCCTNKTPTTKVPESGFDPRFWADTEDQFGQSGLLSGASNKANFRGRA
jgi:hypothetical protein